MRGRKPKPNYLRVLDGGAGHRPQNLDAPEPVGDLIEVPPTLSATQQLIWRGGLASCPPGMLKLIDASVFKNWVVSVDMVEHLRQDIEKFGRVIKGPNGAIVNPLMRELRGYMDKVRQHAAELGFSPTARPRVKVDKSKAPGGGSAFEKLKSLGDD